MKDLWEVLYPVGTGHNKKTGKNFVKYEALHVFGAANLAIVCAELVIDLLMRGYTSAEANMAISCSRVGVLK